MFESIFTLLGLLFVWGLVIGIPILFGWLIYRAVIGIIREVKKKD